MRPFNCVGVGEDEAIGEAEVFSGNVKLRLSHVVPDIINKCLQGQNPLHLLGDGQQVRCYTHGKDIARGIRMAMESEKAVNEDFNISSDRQTTVLELLDLIWYKIHGDRLLVIEHCDPYPSDVQIRSPLTEKAKEIPGFKCLTSLEDALDEIIVWVKDTMFK